MPIKAKWIEFKQENIELIHPNETGVYECGYARGARVVYIGSGSIRARLLSHKQKAKFLGVTHFRKRKTSLSEARRAEEKLLSEFKRKHGKLPKFNKGKPSKQDLLERWFWG
jgi:hypothetical protein